MQKDEAYKILGVKEDTSRNEIEKRYAIILRKYRSGNPDGLTEEEFNKITEAYNLLMGYTVKVEDEKTKRKKPNPVLKKLGIDEDKVSNFFHYYKVHIIIGIIIIAFAISMIRGCVNKVEPDLYVAFMGDMYVVDLEQLETEIKTHIPGVNEVIIENIMISTTQEKQDPQVQVAMLQKAMLLVAVGDVDVIIADKAQFEKFAREGAFMKLDDLALELGIPEDRQYRAQIVDEDIEGNIEEVIDEGIYGIGIECGEMLTNAKTYYGSEMIATISVRAKHYDNAVEFIKILASDAKEE